MFCVITFIEWAGLFRPFVVLLCHTEVTSKPFGNNERKDLFMKKNNSLPIERVTFEYVGTDKQFNEFLRSVIRDYVTDDRTLPEQENTDHNEQNIA